MTAVQIFAILASTLATLLALLMLRRRSFRERHAAWWVFAGVSGVVLSIFPGLVDSAARLLRIADPVNLVFFGSTLILFLVGVQLSSEITSLEARVRRLAEESALQAERMHLLETTLDELERGLRRERLGGRGGATAAAPSKRALPGTEPEPQLQPGPSPADGTQEDRP